MAPETSEPPEPLKPDKAFIHEKGNESAGADGHGDGLSPLTFLGAGLELGASVVVFSLLGWWLDNKWHTRPWMMVIGLAMAMTAGTYRLWKTGKKFFD